MMESVTWTFPAIDKVFLGVEAPATVVSEAERLGCDRVFIVTSASVERSFFLAGIIAALGERHAGTYGGVRAHIPLEDIIAAANGARECGADLILAVGGGSAIDAAKVVPICLHFGVDDIAGLAAHRGFGSDPDPSRRPADEASWVRMIAVPTMLSAAEFTWWGGGLDTARMVKEPYAHPLGMPRSIILDPEATMSAPLGLFLATGMKAVDHSAERLTSVKREPLSEARSIHSLKMLARSLRAIKADPEDRAARLDAQAGMAVGMASPLTGVRVGASHAVGHALGAHSGVQHGLTSCVMLPAVMRWNIGVNADRQAIVAEAMGYPGEAAGDVIERLIRDLGLPTRLRDIGIKRQDFDQIARKVMGDHSIAGNARQPRVPEELVELLEMAW
jgi:maleylacetate reductase